MTLSDLLNFPGNDTHVVDGGYIFRNKLISLVDAAKINGQTVPYTGSFVLNPNAKLREIYEPGLGVFPFCIGFAEGSNHMYTVEGYDTVPKGAYELVPSPLFGKTRVQEVLDLSISSEDLRFTLGEVVYPTVDDFPDKFAEWVAKWAPTNNQTVLGREVWKAMRIAEGGEDYSGIISREDSKGKRRIGAFYLRCGLD